MVGDNRVHGNRVRSRFKTFVAVIFALACVLAIAYVFIGHPGDTKNNVKPLDTSSLSMRFNTVG